MNFVTYEGYKNAYEPQKEARGERTGHQ